MAAIHSIKTKNVNSKSLVDEMIDFVEESLDVVLWDVVIQRESFIEMYEDYLNELMDDNRITQFKLIADKRNNPPARVKLGLYVMEVHFKQKNCLNVTEIQIVIDTKKNIPVPF